MRDITLNELYGLIDKESVYESIVEVIGDDDDFLNYENWSYFDDLDQIEFIMNLEKKFNISIGDDLIEYIFSKSPINLVDNIKSIKRDRILNKLLN